MQVTNFLPDDYLRRRGIRRANWMCLGTAAGTLLLLGAVVAFVVIVSVLCIRPSGLLGKHYIKKV